MSFSGAFWEVGVKKDATAVAIRGYGGAQILGYYSLVVVDCSLRLKGGGEIEPLWRALFLLLTEDILIRQHVHLT